MYKLSGSSQVAPPLHFNPNDILVSVATSNRLPIVHSGDDSPIGSGCVVDETEVDTGSGWSLISLGTLELVTSNGNTYLSVSQAKQLFWPFGYTVLCRSANIQYIIYIIHVCTAVL